MPNNTLNSPGVFRGQARLATQQDVSNLKEYLERVIAGPINELNEDGYIPWKYNADGTLDIDYLFPELISRFSAQQGITIKTNGIKFADNVTKFNVKGKFVTLDIDEDGCLTWMIDEPQVTIPNFNEANMFGTALVKIENEVIEDMIVPDASALLANSPYGDWEPGIKVKGINWNQSQLFDAMRLTTYGPVYASSVSSYFEVQVNDGMGGTFSSFISAPVKASTRRDEALDPASTQNSPHICIYIDDFKEEARGYSFIPRFELNLAKIVGLNGGRFEVKIIHHDGRAYTYSSGDMLYNCGALPSISTSTVQILNDSSSSASDQLIVKQCSGVKYARSGTALVKLHSIHNLNNMAAVDDPVSFHFDISDAESEEIEPFDYDLEFDKTATFNIKFKLKPNTLNNEVATGWAKAKNAFGESNLFEIRIPVLLDSQTTLKSSTLLTENFSDESFRTLSNFEIDPLSVNDYSDVVNWDSTRSLIDYDDGRGLMVVPGKGLSYPYGEWSAFLPAGSPNYDLQAFLSNEKYFARVFTGSSKIKFGGVFVFTGLSRAQFFDSRLSIIISADRGTTWYDLKKTRNMDSVIIRDDGTALSVVGVMTDVREEDGKLFVPWAYPTDKATNQPLYFKLGMKPTSNFVIKSISLLNTDEEEGW